MPAPLVLLLGSVLASVDPIPKDEDVKAGWIGFGLFLTLLVVVGLLGWSLTRHLRNVESNRRTGVFGDAPDVEQVADGDPTGGAIDGSATRTPAGPSDGTPRPV